MKKLLSATALLFLLGCGNASHSEVKQDEINQTVVDLEFDFELIGEVDNKLRHVTRIEVRRKGEASTYQMLNDFSSEVQVNEDVIVEDLNFDGYPDIRLLQYLPSDSNIPFYYWLYEPTSGKFIRNKSMEKITSLAIDRENRYLLSQWTKSKTHVGTDFYRYKGNRLVLVRREIQQYVEPNKYKLITKEPIGDSLQVVKEELIQN